MFSMRQGLGLADIATVLMYKFVLFVKT